MKLAQAGKMKDWKARMNPNILGSIILAAILGIIGTTMYMMGLFDRTPRDGLIDVRVALVNTCDVKDEYFIVYAPQSGKTARFSNGSTNIRVKKGDILRLVIDPSYPAIKYAGYDEKAKSRVELVADCISGERQNMVTRSMRKQFGD